MKKIFFILLLIVFTYSNKGVTREELDQKLDEFSKSPLVSLLLVYDSQSSKAQMLLNLINSIAEKRKGYFNLLTVDCNTKDKDVLQEFVYCSGENRKQLPTLTFSDPALNPDTQEKSAIQGIKSYQGPLDDKNLFNFAVPLMKIYSVQLKTSRDLKKFEQSYPGTPKLVFFTDKQKKQKITPLYRALTANFRDTVVFGHVFANSQIAKDLQIKNFPVFILNGKDKIQAKSNLTQLIQKLEVIKGQKTKIYIKDFEGSNNVELTSANLQQLVYKTPEHILIHVVGQDGKDHAEWMNLTQKFNKMFQFYETFSLKQALGVKQTPSIVYFPKSLAKKSVQKTVFSPKDTYADIHNQLDSMIQDFTVPASNYMQLQKLSSVHLQDQKFVAIFFHTKQIPISYKVLSNDPKLQQQIAFFRMRDPEPQILQQYQIKKLPALAIMIVDKQAPVEKSNLSQKQKKSGKVQMQIKLANYPGKFNYPDLLNFFKSFVRSQTNKQIGSNQHEEQVSDNNSLQEIKKLNKLKNKCQQGCFLLLIDGKPENAQKNTNYLNVFQKQSKRIIGGNYGYIDGTCHLELINSFQILEDELPTLIYVQPKFEKYARMVGRVQSTSVATFITKIKARKAMFRGYNKLQFENKDCQFQHQKHKKISQKSDVISEQQAEILEQLRANQEKKREQFEQSQKDDKIRKKGKKKRPKKDQENEQL